MSRPTEQTRQRLARTVRRVEQMPTRLFGPKRRPIAAAGGKLSYAKVVALFDASGNAWTDYPTDSEYPAYCTANPANADGSIVDTGRTIYIALNSKSDSPIGIITATNEICAYAPGGSAKSIATHPIAGQAVLGYGCWLDWVRMIL